MIPGETIASGAPETCPDCKVTPSLKVLRSHAGYYIGTFCNCGPYSREPEYFRSEEDALGALATGNYGR